MSPERPSADARSRHELAVLNEIAQALNAEVDLGDALGVALRLVGELLGLRTGWVWLYGERPEAPYLAAARELPPALAEHPERMAGGCYCLDTLAAGDEAGAANVNVVTCSRLKWLAGGTRGLRFHASIPLYAGGRALGVLNVASPDWRELSAEDLQLLHTIGDMLGIAVERARLFARSVRIGMTEERNRLAREIHDTLAQDLAAIALQLETADALLGREPAAARPAARAVQRALGQTREALEEARRSVLDLRAAPLEGRTLAQALAELAAEAGAAGPAPVDFRTTEAGRPLPPRLEVGLLRIAQEALANAQAHADARRIELGLETSPTEALLRVEDDGRGFDPTTVGAERFGLRGLRERAALMGGRLRLDTAPGQGTRVLVRVPLRPEDGGAAGRIDGPGDETKDGPGNGRTDGPDA